MRLTKTSDSFGGMVWFRSQDKNDLWLEPCEMTAHDSRRAIDELAAYEDAEEQGLLVRLPCKVGSTVYRIITRRLYYVGEKDIVEVEFNFSMFDEFDKTVFLTREEAEVALKNSIEIKKEN